jgi:thiamine phosphate synthase YjbQ (UPF0047 family)
MKAHSKLLWFHTKQRSEIINITHQVEDVIEESGISDGLALDPKENADAHLQAILCGHHVTVSVSKGRVDLGTYQTVYYAEFDGGRDKEVLVKVVGV